MATLTVNDVTCDVVGELSFSTATRRWRPHAENGKSQSSEEGVSPFLTALVRVPVGVNCKDLHAVDAVIRVELEDGSVFEGYGMKAAGNPSVHGDVMRLSFEGETVSLRRPS